MTAPAVTTPTTETTKAPESGRASVAARQDVFIYTFASGMIVFGMVLLVVSVILLVGLSVAGFPVDWAWLAVLFAFLLILTGLFLAWYYRSLLVKKAEPKAPAYTPTATSYPPVSYTPPSYYSYSGYQGSAYPQYAYPAGQYGYGQAYAGYSPYGAYAAPTPPAIPAPPNPPATPSPPGPSGPSKNCTACGRAVPVEANFCPFCRQRL